jgi:hypothetical protein
VAAHYNGRKSLNGLKHQTVDNAYGFTVDMFGPTSLRRNDLTLLRLSNINDRQAKLQRGSEDQFMTFGDSAYKRRSYKRRRYILDQLLHIIFHLSQLIQIIVKLTRMKMTTELLQRLTNRNSLHFMDINLLISSNALTICQSTMVIYINRQEKRIARFMVNYR